MRWLSEKSIFSGHRPDYALLVVVALLVVGGFFILASASSDLSKIKYDDTYYFLKQQALKGLLPGICGFLLGFFLYYRRWRKLAPWLFLINIILMILVFTPLGFESHGSSRWIDLGSFSFQPSELLKFTFILYLASILSSTSVRTMKKGWKTYLVFLFLSGVVALLILLQPATTMMVIIVGSGAIMYFLGGASLKHFFLTIVLGIVAVGLFAMATPYRLERVAPYWNPVVEKIFPKLAIDAGKTDRFHVERSMIAIGTGGVSGVGFGQSTSKFSVLPEPIGDSIFAVIAEELGFIGSATVLILYFSLFWRGTKIVSRSNDDFARMAALGFVLVISIQTVIHIAANAGLLPFTGVPLPFVSYGGTSLAASLTIMGVLTNISRYS